MTSDCGCKTGIPNIASSDINTKTVSGKLKIVWDLHPENVAMVFLDDENNRRSLTNKEVMNLSMKCASLLCSNGVKKGDVVCNLMYNSMEREVVNFGILLAGAIVMHGDAIDTKGSGFWAPLVQANVKYLILEPDIFSIGWKMMKPDVGESDADIERCTRTKEAPGIQKVFKFRLPHRIPAKERGTVKTTFDIINAHTGMMFTKMSSHEPASIVIDRDQDQNHFKMIQRTHGELVNIGQRIVDMLRSTEDDVVYCDFPLSWLPGLTYNYFTLGCKLVRSTLTDCPPRKVVAETWELIEREKCTMAALQPPMIQMLSSHCEDLADPHWTLRVLTTAGWVRQSVMDAIGPCTDALVICYARIETGLISRLWVDSTTASKYSEGCVGDLTTAVRTRLDGTVGTDKNTHASKIGEILLDGMLVTKAYVNDRALTKVSFTSDGFFITGDIGLYDDRKQLFVLGRKTDAIIRGNVPIFPKEIEEKVNQCPGIWKVKIVSLKDDKGIMQMCACVIPRSDDCLTIDRVKEFCRYQLGGTSDDDENPHMPSYIFFFDSFPTVHGQVNRKMLAYMAADILHGNSRLDN